MKLCRVIFTFSFLFACAVDAQYMIRSPYLLQPERMIPYVDSCAQFWIRAHDTTYGGFYTNVDRQGNVITAWGTNKNLVSQSRDAYGFTRAFMLTGDDRYLAMARSALDFLYAHAWDTLNDGWFSTIDRFGNPTNPTQDKTAFDQHYALLGVGAYCEATDDSLDWQWLMKGYESNESHLWDGRDEFFGYYDFGSSNWATRSGKSFNATVDAVTTHLLSLYLMTGEERYRFRLLELADIMLHRLTRSMDQQAIGFAEKYNSDWVVNSAETMTIMGHVLKTAWCFGRIHQLIPDTSYIAAAAKLVTNVLEKGYDHDFGGPYKDYNRTTGAMLMWGQTDTAKAWWQMQQAVMAGLMLYEITGEEKYLNMADESLDFFMTYFVDRQYGEVYSDRTRRGGQIWGTEKGSNGKAAYHSIELGYYTYLYGKLFVHREPVTLYYDFQPRAGDRTLHLNPVAWQASKYRIQNVEHNGSSYADVEPDSRMLHLPANVGGRFVVTYEPTGVTAVEEVVGLGPEKFELMQNYPNPFNPVTDIRFQISDVSMVSLKVYDVLGREVATLVNEQKEAGSYSVRWDASTIPSGVYFYKLTAGTVSEVKKMLLLK